MKYLNGLASKCGFPLRFFGMSKNACGIGIFVPGVFQKEEEK
jgi:hypothetical protein